MTLKAALPTVSEETGNPRGEPRLRGGVERSAGNRSSGALPQGFRSRLAGEAHELYGFVVRRFGRDVADDTVQEALSVALQNAETFDQSRPMGPWLRTIAANCASKSAGRNGRVPVQAAAFVEDEHVDQGVSHAARVDDREAVDRILERLEPGDASIVRRHHLDGDSIDEIARDLRTPKGTIKARLFRARKRLALALGAAGAVVLVLVLVRGRFAHQEDVEPAMESRVLMSSITFETVRPEAPRLEALDLTTRRVSSARVFSDSRSVSDLRTR